MQPEQLLAGCNCSSSSRTCPQHGKQTITADFRRVKAIDKQRIILNEFHLSLGCNTESEIHRDRLGCLHAGIALN